MDVFENYWNLIHLFPINLKKRKIRHKRIIIFSSHYIAPFRLKPF